MNLQFKRNRSAGTAAEKCSKCSVLAGRPLLLAILLLSAVCCQGQITTDSTWKVATDSSINLSNSLGYLKDSCWWTTKVDTIQTDFVITVDENNFVKKQRTDFIIHKYEKKDCQYSVFGFWAQNLRNDIYLLDGKPVEVLLYRPKNQYGVLVGNSR
jgi:hypothetical protein